MRPGALLLDRRQTSRGPQGGRVPVALVDVGLRPSPSVTGEAGAQWVIRRNLGDSLDEC